MFNPKPLRVGDKIGIVATARKVHLDEMEFAVDFLKEKGLVAVLGNTVGIEKNQFAGDDASRAADFQNMLNDKEIKAIWCARGGYGTVRMIDQLDFSVFKNSPKWIIGYSDITVLHAHLNRLGCMSIHAPMPIDLHKVTTRSKESLTKVLFGDFPSYSISYHANNKMGTGQGQLIGGNLSILYSLCGSRSAVDTHGKILFIEDLDEYLYHIDRMLQNLKRNNYFEGLKGLIVGGMTDMHDNTIPFGKTVEEIILEVVEEYDFPVVFNFPAGHIEDNQTLVLGAEVTLSVHKEKVELIPVV